MREENFQLAEGDREEQAELIKKRQRFYFREKSKARVALSGAGSSYLHLGPIHQSRLFSVNKSSFNVVGFW